MAKVKYYYDPDTLSYRKIEKRTSEKYKQAFLVVSGFFLIAFLGFIGFSQFLLTPKERSQKRELVSLTGLDVAVPECTSTAIAGSSKA